MARLNVEQDETTSSASDSGVEDASSNRSKRQSLRQLGKSIKTAPKRVLLHMNRDTDKHIDGKHRMDVGGKEIEGITDNPAFNTGEVVKSQEETDDQNHSLAQSLSSKAHYILHPQEKARKKAAQNFQPTQHPFLTSKADRELLDAHEDLRKEGLDDEDADTNTDPEEIDKRIAKVNKLESERADMRDAWITSRHVQRARISRTGLVAFPNGKDYRVLDEQGNFLRFQWERYLGHVLLYWTDDFGSAYVDDSSDLSFRRGTLLRQVERVYLSSIHWQSWSMHVRTVYMWEDPILTMRWFLTWLFLLKTGYVLTFLYCFVIFIVVRNRYFPTTTTELQWSQERIMNEDKHVLNFGELISRHNGDQWLEPVLDELGPVLQQQLGDLADFLEILYNFYNWEDPRATTYTVILCLSCALLAGLTSSEFGNSVVFWLCGFYFFFSRPIASRYPRYRHLVSILRWAFWEIPTHAELAFQHLGQSARKHRVEEHEQQYRDRHLAEDSVLPHEQTRSITAPHIDVADDCTVLPRSQPKSRSSSPSSSQDPVNHNGRTAAGKARSRPDKAILSFQGIFESQPGQLIVTETGVRFEQRVRGPGLTRHTTREVAFVKPYTSFLELQKVDSVAIGKRDKAKQKLRSTPREELILMWTDESETRIAGMEKRDECFNTIVGFSGERWQVLRPLQEADGMGEGKSGHGGKTNFGGEGKGALDELGKLW